MNVEVLSSSNKTIEIVRQSNISLVSQGVPLGGITQIIQGGTASGVTFLNGLQQTVSLTGSSGILVSINGQTIIIAQTGSNSDFSGVLQTQLDTLNNNTGNYYLNSNPSGYITGFNSGLYVTTSQTGQFYPASNPQNYVTSGNLQATGQSLQTQVSAITAGTGNFISAAQTGQFYPASNPNQYATSGNLFQTGSNLDGKINSLSGNSVLLYGNQNINGLKTFYTGAQISGNGIDFLNTSDPSWREGRLFYDTADMSLSYYNDNTGFHVKIGQQEIARVVNNHDSLISGGQPVYIDGSQGNRPSVKLAIASSLIANKVLGISAINIAKNQNGYVVTRGVVKNLNTSAFSAGDSLYLSPFSSGTFINYEPDRPNFVIKIGTVLNSHSNQGSIYVNILEINHDLHHLYDVDINTGNLQNNDLLIYNQSSGRWLNQSSFSGVLQNQINSINNNTGQFYLNSNPYQYIRSGDVSSVYSTITNLQSTGANLQNQINSITNNTGQFYLSSNPQQYVNSGNLFNTGNTLDNKINSLSGYSNSNFYTKNNESGFLNTLSGLSLAYVNSVSGDLSNRLGITGQTLLALISSSSAGIGSLNGLSGTVNILGAGDITVTTQGQNITISGNTGVYSSFATVTNLAATGLSLQNQITNLSSNTGNYYLNSNPSGFITGLNTGLFVSVNQTGQFYPASNPQSYATSGNVQATGQSLQSQVSAITAGTGNFISAAQTGQFYPTSNPQNYIRSGDVSSTYSTLSNVTLTGQTLDSKINSLSGYSDSNFYLKSNPSGYLNTLSGLSTGYITGISGNLQSQINNTNNNLSNSGSNLDSKINSLSGYSNNSFATIGNLFSTGTNLQLQLNVLSNNTGSYYPRTNPSGYLTGFNSGLYVTINETGQFYPSSNPNQYVNSGNLYSTGSILNSKIDSLSGYTNNTFSSVTVTGSNKVLNPNFSGIGGAQVILSGINTILISGGAGGPGGNTTNNYYINSGSGLFLFRNNLTNGLDKQFITYPISIDYVPLIVAGVRNDVSDILISCQVSGANTTGFWAVFSNTLVNTGYYLDVLTCNPVGTGIGISNISVNNSVNYSTGSQIFVTGAPINTANLTGLGNITVTSNNNIIYFSGANAGGGETNTASNLGNGLGLYNQKIGVDLQFNSISGGTGISLSSNNNTILINYSPRKFQITVDFGFTGSGQGDIASYTFSGNSGNWVTENSNIICFPMGKTTINHDPDDVVLDNITAYVSNIYPGTGFDVIANAPNGTFGSYVIGVNCFE